MSIAYLQLLPEYRTGENDPVESFLKPLLAHSTDYSRAVGYFSSTVYALIGPEIISFVNRGGHCKIVCSPQLSKEDSIALTQAYSDRDAIINESIDKELRQIANSTYAKKPLELLATLVALSKIEIKIAFRPGFSGLFHEKLGIFEDDHGSVVSFKGSSNETLSAWHLKGNFESFEVFKNSGSDSDGARAIRHKNYFEKLWNNKINGLDVKPFPIAAKKKLIKYKSDQIAKQIISNRAADLKSIELYSHQENALENWSQNGQRGILKHATGSGKTITALTAISSHIRDGSPAVVLVPAKLLLVQWRNEIKKHLPNANLLCMGAGYTRWKRSPELVSLFLRKDPELGPRIILATIKTFNNSQIGRDLQESSRCLLVVDEVHQAGSYENSKCLETQAKFRLGLSATPERYGDPCGTEALIDYFGGIVEPEYTLQNALDDGRLSPYEYYPHFPQLNAEEADEWEALSKEIRRQYGRNQAAIESGKKDDVLKRLVIRRSRIAKKAHQKLGLAREILKSNFNTGQRWIVYCEDAEQLDSLRKEIGLIGITCAEYTQAMAGDPKATLDAFRSFDGVLLAIKCLDEGVDIPVVDHALILASSQNPRQFIQRRGRVLRKAPGKTYAVIHDAIVRNPFEVSHERRSSFFTAELARANSFAALALNSDSAGIRISRVAIDDGIDLEKNLEKEDLGYE